MDTPLGYIYAITEEEIQLKWPNLQENQNFHFTSLKRRQYNCVGWAVGENKSLDMLAFRDIYKLDPTTLNHTVKGYAEKFNEYYGFEVCDNGNYEVGFEKILLYENEQKDFAHVARLLPNGHWTSKMGGYEDIEHYKPEAVNGNLYGRPVLYMKRVLVK